MGNEWQSYCLGDLIEIVHGYAFKGEYFTDLPTNEILLTPGNFAIGGGFKYDKLKYYKGKVPEDYVLTEGDLLITMTDLSKQADTLGYPAIVPRSSGERYLHNQRLGRVVIRDEGKLDKRFLFYLLCTNRYRQEVIASATGTTVKHTAPKRIAAFKFKLPSLREQHTIAHVLGSLDDKIELNCQMNRTLEQMAQAIFKSWFIDFDPVVYNAVQAGNPVPARFEQTEVRYRDNPKTQTLARNILDLFPDRFEESELGEIPAGWCIKPLDKIADFLNGLACQKYPPEPGEPSLPVIKIRELRQGISANTDQASHNVPTKYMVNNGDVLFSWSGSLLIHTWTQGQGVLNQHVFKITSDEYPRWFYYYWTEKHLVDFQRIAADKATTMGHIKRHHLTEAKVLVPPKKVMDVATSQVSSLFDRQIENKIESEKLSNIRDTLIPKLISGEMRLSEPEKFLEGEH